MSEYHKINAPWKRHLDGPLKGKFIDGQWSRPEFEYLKDNQWTWDEKIDGTNMRVYFDGEQVRFQGRTDKAQIPPVLIERMNELFTVEKMKEVFENTTNVVLYGEGYGRKIQKVGSLYLPDSVDFILFDVRIGHWWMQREDVERFAEKLGVKVTPIVGSGTIQEAVELVTADFQSQLGYLDAEGLILRTETPLFARNGSRVITKLKTKDFELPTWKEYRKCLTEIH